MRAMVMAAGLGTRLKPLTDDCPKPLVPVLGKPMIVYVLEHLASCGIKEALLNIHYLPEKMRDFVKHWNEAKNIPHLFIQDESKMILGSGGGIAKAARWLFENDSVAFICNADVIAFPSLREMQEARTSLHSGCTLVVSKHAETGRKYNGLRVENGLVKGFEKPGVPDPSLFHFIGYYLIDRESALHLPHATLPQTVAKAEEFPYEYSIVDVLWKAQVKSGKLGVCEYQGTYLDLGTPEDLREAEAILSRK